MDEATVFGISTAWIIASTWSALIALAVLVAGWILAGFLSRHVATILPRQLHRDVTIIPLVSQVVRYGILLVTIIIVLGQFGVQTASILAVLGAAGLAIALALQGTLSNIAAGILLLLLRPFNVGDSIDADGIAGTVVEIGLFATQMRTGEGVFMFAPNSRLSNAKIINYSREPARIVELSFNVPRSADLDRVREGVRSGLTSQRTVPNASADLQIATLGDTTITMLVRVPVRSAEWSAARSELQEKLKSVIDGAGGFVPSTPA